MISAGPASTIAPVTTKPHGNTTTNRKSNTRLTLTNEAFGSPAQRPIAYTTTTATTKNIANLATRRRRRLPMFFSFFDRTNSKYLIDSI
jgi:hypothetical protein